MSNTSYILSYNNENGYGWYECNCCPYGYHIDLDFVRYCETIGRQTERTGSIQRRRDRRRQRQSMDMLLGLAPPLISNIEQNTNFKTINENERGSNNTTKSNNTDYKIPFIHDELDDVVNDFERTLQRSKTKLSNNLPDVTAVSDNIHRVPSMSSITSASSIPVLPPTNDLSTSKDFDTVSIESCGLSPIALQNIREQMALSLERTRKLEDQISIIPKLKAQLSDLKEENNRLTSQLQLSEASKLNNINANYITNNYSRIRSHSLTEVDNCDDNKQQIVKPPRRDFGVMCGVLTRNIGVGHQYPNTRSVSTTTPYNEEMNADRWLDEKYKFLNGNKINDNIKLTSTKNTQTLLPRDLKHTQTQTAILKQKEFANKCVQSIVKKNCQSVGVFVRPDTVSKALQNVAELVSVASSNDTINDEYCLKCCIEKKSIGVGPENNNITNVAPISLASLTNKSKSFNLGEERLNLTSKSRTVACQYENNNLNKASQYQYTGVSKSCQHELRYSTKASQYDIEGISKMTDTKDLRPILKSVGCEAKEYIEEIIKKDVGCNTNINMDNVGVCAKCSTKERSDAVKKDKDDAPSSRIPRLQMPTTPTENRKFKRQDTYTKIPALIPASPSISLSGLDLTTKSIESPNTLDKVKENFKFYPTSTGDSDTQISTTHNGINLPSSSKDNIESLQPLHETAIYNQTTSSQRKKAMPSKEMQAAMKVVNDALRKNNNKNIKNQLKSATNIIQQEWFKISSCVNADPLDVEDYLDCFEDVSNPLLEYIVNMTDASGNTAMHYAVSHGNFDVVSILLDSKVCDINKQNKAGYTSVMLVSLAEVRSKTHAQVVRRLFQLADVNIRAKQHGQTALMLAVSHGRLDMVQMLLEAGADINIQDEDGSTALMCAAEHGHAELVKHFLTHADCDTSLCDVDGSTALNIAMEAGHRHIGLLLYAHDRNLHDPKVKKHKSHSSSSGSTKVPSSPSLPMKSFNRALPDTKK